MSVENGKGTTGKAPPVTSRMTSIGDIVGQGLVALCVGAVLGIIYSYWPKIMQLFK